VGGSRCTSCCQMQRMEVVAAEVVMRVKVAASALARVAEVMVVAVAGTGKVELTVTAEEVEGTVSAMAAAVGLVVAQLAVPQRRTMRRRPSEARLPTGTATRSLLQTIPIRLGRTNGSQPAVSQLPSSCWKPTSFSAEALSRCCRRCGAARFRQGSLSSSSLSYDLAPCHSCRWASIAIWGRAFVSILGVRRDDSTGTARRDRDDPLQTGRARGASLIY
jgi:hypothetical protein